jgi:hypothetical protein
MCTTPGLVCITGTCGPLLMPGRCDAVDAVAMAAMSAAANAVAPAASAMFLRLCTIPPQFPREPDLTTIVDEKPINHYLKSKEIV